MKKFLVLISVCIATYTNVMAQDEDEDDDDEVYVYVSDGCKYSDYYHMSLYCPETKFCRHEHDKNAVKRCPETCVHRGHISGVTLDVAENRGKTPCPKCCDVKGKKKNKGKDKWKDA